MPGHQSSSSPKAQYLQPWAVYRFEVAVNDNLAVPGDVVEAIGASRMPDAAGLQVWLTPCRVSGTGTVDLTVFQALNGSLTAVSPFKQATATMTGVASLEEQRVEDLLPAEYRVLITGMDPGSVWTLHYTMVSSRTSGTSPVTVVAEWERPSDWLVLPTLTPTDEKFVGLLAITNDDSNYVALSASGDYTVDWGDGSLAENVAAGVQAEHQFAWGDLSPTTLSSLGYRQTVVTVTPQAGQHLTAFSLQKKHSALLVYTPNIPWLDVSLGSPWLTVMEFWLVATLIRLYWLQKVTIASMGPITNLSNLLNALAALRSVSLPDTSAVTNFSGMFSDCYTLSRVPIFDTASGLDFSNLFNGCAQLTTIPLLNTRQGTNFGSFLKDCYRLTSVPLLDLSSALDCSYMFSSCGSLTAVPLFDLSSVSNASVMFSNCCSLKKIPLFDFSSANNVSNLCTSCYSLKEFPIVNMASATNFNYMFQNCYELEKILLTGTGAGLSFSGMFANCRSLVEAPDLDTHSATDLWALYLLCVALVRVPALNTTSVENFSNMFSSCYSLKTVPALNTAAGTNFGQMMFRVYTLSSSALSGTRFTISYAGCLLSRSAIVDIFNGLGVASGAQTITVSANPGTAALTAPDLAIATGKGWTVTV